MPTNGQSASQVKVLSQLMQNHRLAAPVSGGAFLCAACDGTGQLEVFSLSSSGHVYQLYQDASSDSGWSVRDLQYPGTAAFLGCAANPDSTITVVASDGAAIQTLTLPSTPGTTTPGWRTLPAIAVGGIRTGIAPWGEVVICIYNPNDRNFYMLDWSGGEPSWSAGLRTTSNPLVPAGWTYCQTYDADYWDRLWPGVVWTGEQASTPNELSLIARGWWAGSGYGASADGDYSVVSAIANAQGGWDVFALNRDDLGMYHLQVQMNNLQYAVSKISEDTACTTVAAGRFVPPTQGASALLQAFALSTQGYLYVTQQDPSNGGAWGDFIALSEDLSFTQITTAVNGEGNTELFAIAAGDGALYHIWQDAASTDWNFDEVEVAADGQLEDVPTYQTLISVTDAAGLPSPFVAATIACPNSDDVELQINGSDVRVGSGAPWSGTTDSQGTIVVNQAVSALGTPVLQLSVTGIPDGSIPAIDPSATIHGTLASVTGQQLIDAGLLPPGSSDADQVAQGVRQALAQAPGPAALTAGIHAGSDMRVFSATGGRLGAAPAGAQAWSFDTLTGAPRFQFLTPEAAATTLARMRALPGLDAGLLSSLKDAWGDVVSAVKRGAAKVVQWVVTPVTEGLQVALTLVIQGVQYVFNAVITLVEEAFDLAEQIFSSAGVYFDKLFAWLGYVFNWQNILRTQDAAVYAINEVLQFFQDAAATIKQNVDANLASFVNDRIGPLFTQLQSSLGVTTMGQYQTSNTKPLQGFDAPAARLMGTHLMLNASGAVAAPTLASARADLNPALQAVLDKVQSLVDTYGVNQDVKNAEQFFTAALNSQDQYLQLALAGMLSLVEAATKAVVMGVQLLADAVLEGVAAIVAAIQATLNQEWTIPVVSNLYARMTQSATNPNGLSLTALSLAGLLVAAPATVVYTAASGAPPFADEGALQTFKASFTSAALLQSSGLGGASQPATAAVTRALTAGAGSAAAVFAYLQAGTLVLTSLVEPIVDLQIPEGIGPGSLTNFSPPQAAGSVYSVLGVTVLVLEVSDVVFSIPWVGGARSWSPGSPEGWECYGWCKDAVKLLIDMAFYAAERVLPRQTGDGGSIFEFIAGFLDIPCAACSLILGGNGWQGAAGLIGGVGDGLRIGRVKQFIEASEGVSLLVLACADVVGNRIEAGLTIAGTLTATAAPTTPLTRVAGAHGG